MPSRIHLLADPLVSQIAAGEVVERPASVVKELIENALDAGAREVEVLLEAGGKGRVAVADDGCGMGADDALLAFDRHATSKIASFADLERIGTLGFRGEALAAIASVARVELVTAERPGDGHRVLIEGGRVRVAEPLARPRGTTLDVRSLFFNVPARRKFLKSPETELRRALEVAQGYALARPDVRWRVLHEGRALLDLLPAAGPEGPRQRIAQLFGDDLASRLVDIGTVGEIAAIGESGPIGENGAAEAGMAGQERIGGLVGSPETARGRRQFVFVNRRLLRDRAVLATFYRAVREEWRSDDVPALFLFLDLPPEELDVNVHPQKAEVRFRDPRLLDRVAAALRPALARARGEVAAPLRRPAADAPTVPFAWQGLGGPPTPAAWGGWSRSAGSGGSPYPEVPVLPGPRAMAGEIAEVGGGAPAVASDAGAAAAAAAGAPPQARLATASYLPPERAAVPLSGRRGEARPFRLLGQYKGTLILLEGPDGLYLVDQHVAHERILYERLRRSLAAATPPSQVLLSPLLLDLSPAERLRLLELAPALEPCGFGFTVLSGQTLALTAVPAVLSAGEAEALLAALADGSPAGEPSDGGLGPRVLDALAASLACKAAVKMHHPLSPPEMESLLTELFAADQPYACPHGRPIVLQMTDSDLERRFGRR
ncbi:MAG TPA: DNA mismatch repair endonuclease MutL [Thermoanaerobaculia bacterium]|jgi:DNA mismatch repair protein MutL|nr:DNA mismatch repair endonuclease MutL [Thermoanaerobaculia bacterium]